jgi:hypothetical protein
VVGEGRLAPGRCPGGVLYAFPTTAYRLEKARLRRSKNQAGNQDSKALFSCSLECELRQILPGIKHRPAGIALRVEIGLISPHERTENHSHH